MWGGSSVHYTRYGGEYQYRRARLISALICLGCCLVLPLFIAALIVRFAVYGQQTLQMVQAETRTVSHINTQFTSAADFSGDSMAQAFLFEHTPPLTGPTAPFSNAGMTTIYPDSYEYFSYFLHPGSTVQIKTCPQTTSIALYLFRGESNFNAWLDDASTVSWFASQYYSPGGCTGSPYTYQFTASSDDTYYVTWANTYTFGNPSTVTYNITVARTQYNTSNARESCRVPCSLSYAFGSSRAIVVAVDPSADMDSIHTVRTNFDSRPGMYFLAFGLPVLCVLSLVLLCCTCRRRRRAEAVAVAPVVVASSDQTPLLGTTPQTYVVQQTEMPPPYYK